MTAPSPDEMYSAYADWCARTGARLFPRGAFLDLLERRWDPVDRLVERPGR